MPEQRWIIAGDQTVNCNTVLRFCIQYDRDRKIHRIVYMFANGLPEAICEGSLKTMREVKGELDQWLIGNSSTLNLSECKGAQLITENFTGILLFLRQ